MSDPIAATRAWALLRSAVWQCDSLRDKSTGGEYPTNIPHPIQWEIDKLVTVIQERLEAQRGRA